MDPFSRFREYAASFEEVVKTDDWSLLEPYFAEDAVYEVIGGEPFGGLHEGRDAILAHMKRSLDGFDRRFDTRQLEILEGPALSEGAVWFRWRITYVSEGLPELVIDGQESVTIDNDLIVRLEDRFPPHMTGITQAWFNAYGDKLPPAGR